MAGGMREALTAGMVAASWLAFHDDRLGRKDLLSPGSPTRNGPFSPRKLAPLRNRSSSYNDSETDRRGHRGLRVDLDALRQVSHKGLNISVLYPFPP